jgi:hypothetical protein
MALPDDRFKKSLQDMSLEFSPCGFVRVYVVEEAIRQLCKAFDPLFEIVAPLPGDSTIQLVFVVPDSGYLTYRLEVVCISLRPSILCNRAFEPNPMFADECAQLLFGKVLFSWWHE